MRKFKVIATLPDGKKDERYLMSVDQVRAWKICQALYKDYKILRIYPATK